MIGQSRNSNAQETDTGESQVQGDPCLRSEFKPIPG